MFQNTLIHLYRQAGRYLPAYKDGTDRVSRNVGIQNSDAGELPRRKHTTKEHIVFLKIPALDHIGRKEAMKKLYL